MQIDFHLGVTYVLARMSGFSPYEANTIASSSQYVDDAVNSGTIFFENRSVYEFRASAHKMLDYRNFKELANHHVWIPFHFIPGNEVRDQGIDSLAQKLVCRPNSKIAQDVVHSCVTNFNKPFGYHLLGVTTHAFVDTWAHQGFAGITHELNKVSEIYDGEGALDADMMNYRKKFYRRNPFRRMYDWVLSFFVGEYNPIGHGTVLSYPDLPYLRWSYQDWQGRTIQRDNPSDYMQAIHHVLAFYQEVRKTHGLPVVKIFDEDLKKLKELIQTIDNEEGEERLQKWREHIQCGTFQFGTDTWNYSVEGKDGWLSEAFEDIETNDDFDFNSDLELLNVPYKEEFLKSNWKLMHDALLFYRFTVLHDVLPRYQICVA
ncbi:DUF6765 family protein [Bdellovibrio sp. GT3]|uniref:DUF6765 family protein n=1 Tax=Bdellovibrio sp. GT3 TaxID=3136282 RepID=UPI0030F0C190